jgi:hypothetical protein
LLTADRPPVRLEPRWSRAGAATFVLLGLLCVSLEAAFAQNAQPDNQSNSVHGVVVNAFTHEPIGRALVYSPDNRYATFSDGEGHFEFTLPKVGTDGGVGSGGVGNLSRLGDNLPSLMARKPGFLDDPNDRRPTEAAPGSEITISLMPEALIKGRVSLPAAEPVRRISVQLLIRQVQDGSPRWMPRYATTTNSNGEFRFAELPPGSYKLFTHEWMDNDPEGTVPGGQLYGCPPVYYPAATDFAAASAIQLTAGQTFEADMLLVRQPYYPVKIPVVNADANGGMQITVSPQGQHGPGYSLGYNNGRGTIEGALPNGKYLVEASRFGPNSSASGSVNIVVAGAPVEGPAMVVAPNNSIRVNVKEEFTSTERTSSGTWSDGKHTYPLRGARLDLQIGAEAIDDFGVQRGGFVRPPTDQNDDSLVLENLSPGRYWLRLMANRGYVASATMSGTDLLREPLVVVPGASASIDVTMRDDNAEVEGTLLGVTAASTDSSRWSPAAFVYCIPLPDSPGQFQEIGASPDGKFNFRTVAPGVYRVIAFSSQQRDIPYRDAEAMKVYENKGQVVHFAAGQKVTLQLQISSAIE